MMIRRLLPLLMAVLSLSVCGAGAAAEAPGSRAGSYILVDANTGVPIALRNADEPRAVASTQKIITAMVVIDQGNLGRKVRVESSDVDVEPTRLGIRPGDVYTVQDLLYAFLVKSANDVGKMLARVTGGSQEGFANMMNAKARALGMKDSYFVNPHGLPASRQHSTARDMARAALMAYRTPLIRDAVKREYFTFRYSSGKSVTLQNTNALLGRMPECNGMKTGYTNAAGKCLISSAAANGRAVILVQLKSRYAYVFDDAAVLMRWGLARASKGSLR